MIIVFINSLNKQMGKKCVAGRTGNEEDSYTDRMDDCWCWLHQSYVKYLFREKKLMLKGPIVFCLESISGFVWSCYRIGDWLDVH